MGEADQAAAVALLADPASHGGQAVERMSTHAAHVFLVGDTAYKMKRAVDLGFLDFSALADRKRYLEREIELNAAGAPGLYRRVLAVTRSPDGKLALAGAGEAVEYVLEMARFDQAARLDHIVERGAADAGMMRALAATVAAMLARAEPRPDADAPRLMLQVIDNNDARFRADLGTIFEAERVERLAREQRRAVERHRRLMTQRARGGLVRRCHGDLHLANIVVRNGLPVPFDALEFNEDLAVTDVLYDVAFLAMDLWARGRREFARLVLEHYLQATMGLGGLALLPLFLSLRAAVRSHVHAAMRQPEVAQRYFALAEGFLAPPPPVLVAIGGLSGTGKSTLARALAAELGPAPGALVWRSDALRKALFDVPETQALPPAAYGREAGQRVYRTLFARGRDTLAAGHAAILDAVFLLPEERDRAQRIAEAMGARWVGLWLEASPEPLAKRVADRRNDASDATVAVLKEQLTRPTGRIAWHRLDAGGTPDDVAKAARALVLRKS